MYIIYEYIIYEYIIYEYIIYEKKYFSLYDEISNYFHNSL